MGFGYGLDAIGKAFIAIAFLVGMIECLTLFTITIAEKLPGIPDSYHWTVSYGFSCALASWICWQGHFDLFTLLGFDWWQYRWLGYTGTGCIIGGGTKRLMLYLKNVRALPGSLTGTSTYSSVLDSSFESTPSETSVTPESNQKGDE